MGFQMSSINAITISHYSSRILQLKIDSKQIKQKNEYLMAFESINDESDAIEMNHFT